MISSDIRFIQLIRMCKKPCWPKSLFAVFLFLFKLYFWHTFLALIVSFLISKQVLEYFAEHMCNYNCKTRFIIFSPNQTFANSAVVSIDCSWMPTFAIKSECWFCNKDRTNNTVNKRAANMNPWTSGDGYWMLNCLAMNGNASDKCEAFWFLLWAKEVGGGCFFSMYKINSLKCAYILHYSITSYIFKLLYQKNIFLLNKLYLISLGCKSRLWITYLQLWLGNIGIGNSYFFHSWSRSHSLKFFKEL